ncbi:hypothetical protein ABEB36_013482 [Hypothenemus hampei]|uniref:Uncharacterized protein n=1 Tax=Hypothenemus hampei TaxID=57062 RepID=A0ABD1E4M3_HYPHA
MALIESGNIQNVYLYGLISVIPILRRRPRKSEEEARLNQASYKFKIQVMRNVGMDVDICKKAFLSIHGISKSKVEYLCLSGPVERIGVLGGHTRSELFTPPSTPIRSTGPERHFSIKKKK